MLTIGAMALQANAAKGQASAEADAAFQSAQAQANELSQQKTTEAMDRSAQGRRERARMLVSAGESGLSLASKSFEADMANNMFAQSRDTQTILDNSALGIKGINSRLGTATAGIKSNAAIGSQFIAGSLSSVANSDWVKGGSGLQIKKG